MDFSVELPVTRRTPQTFAPQQDVDPSVRADRRVRPERVAEGPGGPLPPDNRAETAMITRVRLSLKGRPGKTLGESHHPAVHEFITRSQLWVTTTGALASREILAQPESVSIPPPTQVGSEYFEWVDLFEAVIGAGESFTMVELGAGYGRWTVECYQALRIYHGDALPRHHFVAVEPEPTHFAWLKRHVARNGLSSRATLIEAAVAAADGREDFYVGIASEWYGQTLTRLPGRPPPGAAVKEVSTVSLASILSDLEAVDLMTVDIQGAEVEVLSSAVDSLAIVNRLSIGTHSPEAEAELRELFEGLGWQKVHDFTRGQNDTPWGEMEFHDDGLQTWIPDATARPFDMSGGDA
jgi:FkbM family methyltransferase